MPSVRSPLDGFRSPFGRGSGGAAGDPTSLLFGRSNGFSLDFTRATDDTVEVKDTTTPANAYSGSFDEYTVAAGSFVSPKLCLQEDGSLKYNDHNDVLQSADFNTTWVRSNCTATAGQVGPDGITTDATLITTSATTAYITQTITGLANGYRTGAFVAKAGTSSWCYIQLSDGAGFKRAWFNLATGAVGTVDAGITATISAVDDDGNAYAAGFYYIAVHGAIAAAASAHRLYHASADNSLTGVSGQTLYVSRAQVHRGIKRLGYIATTTAAKRGPAYDWTSGEKLLRYDPATNYRARASDDLTNATYWTLADCTAALDATGPHGEPCSTLTMTANGGTAKQAVTSAGTSQMFFAFVRRKTGTGALNMSVDDGVTRVDVTADIGPAGGAYGLVYLRGAVANPTIEWWGETSGDEFEIALSNVAAVLHVPAPNPNKLVDYAQSIDVCSFPFTAYPSAAEMTFFTDFYTHESGDIGGRSRFGFFGAGAVKSTIDHNATVTGTRLEHSWNEGASALDENFGDSPSAGGRTQIQHTTGANDYACAADGNVAWWNAIPGAMTFTSWQITIAQSIWLRRLLIIPERVADEEDELRLFKLDTTAPNVNSDVLASAFVAKVVHDSTGILRIPGLEVLSVSGDVCTFITVWGQRYTDGYNLEAPQRMMQRKWSFNRATNVLTPTTGATVIYEPAGWTLGALGWGTQGYTPIRIKNGPYTGRLVLIYMQQDTPDGSPDARSLYVTLSDDDGATWSTGVKFLDKSVFAGGAAGFAATGENSTSFQFESGTHEGRVYVSLNGNNSNFYAMWTDDFKTGGDGSGENWTYSTTPVTSTSGGFGTLSEPAISYWPDDTIVMAFRNTGGGNSCFATSTDYGVTFGTAAEIAGDNVSWNVNCGFVQGDPNGDTGTYGRLIYGRSTLNGRLGHKIQSATDAALTMGNNYRLFSPNRFIGYCPLKKAFPDDTIYLCMAETQPTVSSNVNTSQMIAVFNYDP